MILYVLGKFPAPSETFILRELEELARQNILVRVFRLRAGGARELVPLLEPTFFQSLLAAARSPIRTLRILLDGWRHVRSSLKDWFYFTAVVPRIVWAADAASVLPVARVHAHWATVPALAGMILARELGVRFSFTTHAYDLFTSRSLLPTLYPAADRVVTVSHYNREWISRRWGEAATRRARVVYCGLPQRFRMGRPARRFHPQTIFCTCRLVPNKGVDLLIRAMPEIARTRPDVKLIVFGAGPMRGQLEALASELATDRRIEFRGWVAERDLIECYDAGGIWALPCRRMPDGDQDGIPVSLLEAMARDLAVVTTPISGIPEVIRHKENGWLVEPDSMSGLAAALIELLGDARLCDRLGDNAGRTIDERFLIETTIQPLAEIFSTDAAD